MLTESSRLRDFPALADQAYLNTAAESIPPLCVGEAIQRYWQDKLLGMKGRDHHGPALEACRQISATMLGLKHDEVSFCSCSSEAYNLLATSLNLSIADEVVITDLDFPAGATAWLRAANAPKVHVWKADDGELQPDSLEPLLNDKTKLVQVSLISFYNGHRIQWSAFHQTVRRLAPNAIISVDLTQALGRVVLDCHEADILISSTHKWTLGIHGGCIIGIPKRNAERLTTRAGGWYHLQNAFDADRFERAVPKVGALSYSVGMPNFVSLYALTASLTYLRGIGIKAISDHADPLVCKLHEGLMDLGLAPMAPIDPSNPTGIVSFKHEWADEVHAALLQENIHVMNHAGRIRVAVHGYNTQDDILRLLRALAGALRRR
jgi:cysteine desulfurase / selenocysteine lyase